MKTTETTEDTLSVHQTFINIYINDNTALRVSQFIHSINFTILADTCLSVHYKDPNNPEEREVQAESVVQRHSLDPQSTLIVCNDKNIYNSFQPFVILPYHDE